MQFIFNFNAKLFSILILILASIPIIKSIFHFFKLFIIEQLAFLFVIHKVCDHCNSCRISSMYLHSSRIIIVAEINFKTLSPVSYDDNLCTRGSGVGQGFVE